MRKLREAMTTAKVEAQQADIQVLEMQAPTQRRWHRYCQRDHRSKFCPTGFGSSLSCSYRRRSRDRPRDPQEIP
ncbi:hypothetical protein ISN44_As13g012590 [Arabidopsis suecica]|uniref:Uncharacterized protein n=1 Tax=Arabidopsis suecica TaxID=45249 RepID=A0A8T1XX44_ARASU|nr:hypothetical protein ISN44_As13g012590 [Arabidopsis suecica]